MMDSFKDLYEFLQEYKENTIITWLEESWKGKDKQESLLRLFAGLNIIDKLNEYYICKGNFNKKTIVKHEKIKDIFYNESNDLIKLKDKGDSSDLTGISKNDDKHLLVTTSKNLNKTHVGKLDIDKILTNFKQYNNEYTMSICICIRNFNDYNIMKERIEETNKELKLILEKEDTIIIDWNDLNQAYHQFKLFYKHKPLESIIDSNKNTLCLKFHQNISVVKTMIMKNLNQKRILWGHIQRSGKSYIMAGCIIEDSKIKETCNYLVITTAPNETIDQQRKVFDCLQLQDFNIVILNGKNKKPLLTNKNIIICSKQFLQTKLEKTKNITWLKNIKFDIRFIDESHNGGTTVLAKKTLAVYGKNVFTVQITATYSKPSIDFNIDRENWLLWDLEDIKLCKNLDKENNMNRLIEKHGNIIKKILTGYSIDNIIKEYSKYPELWVLTDSLSEKDTKEIIEKTKDNDYGWSPFSCFLLKQGFEIDKQTGKKIKIISNEFQNEEENLKIWYRIFGKRGKFGIPDEDYPDKSVFIKRVEKICKNSSINSRFIGDGKFKDEPMIIMAFLPQNNINNISIATINLLKRNNVLPEYDIISINSKTTNNPKQCIEDARIIAKNNNKKGILVLSGRQCSLGVSIKNCDITLLLNNNSSFDMIYQMMFRCMTEGEDKKCGFVIDLNLNRVIKDVLIKYALQVKPGNVKESLKFILQERLIILNGDNWIPNFGNYKGKLSTMCDNIYDIYISNPNMLKNILNLIDIKNVNLTNNNKEILSCFLGSRVQKNTKVNLENHEKKIKDGYEKIYEEEENKEEENKEEENKEEENKEEENKEEENKEEENKEEDILDSTSKMLKKTIEYIIPLTCLLTIQSDNTTFLGMYDFIKNNDKIYKIFIDRLNCINVNKEIILTADDIINTIYNLFINDNEINIHIIKNIKDQFILYRNNSEKLSKLIDLYYLPHDLEKKKNAEVSTPHKLRQEMLDKIPKEFWAKPHKVFEPCCGKGGFVLDIIDRFMEGLSTLIPDKNLRYKTIIEECLYYADINEVNIFIVNLLIDSGNQYKLNYYEGNTLKLNIKDKWNLDGFDAVIGNPPYNSSGSVGTGNTIWQHFVKQALNKLLNEKGYLLFVHPPGWRKPNTIRGKFYGLFKLMTKENQMIYLSMHSIKDGQKIFNCGTRYDWYVIEKTKKYKETVIKDINNIIYNMYINNFEWLPNSNLELVKKILANDGEEKCEILCDFSYSRLNKKLVSKNKNNEYKYDLIYLTPKKGIRFMYSNSNTKGHFNVSKIIIGETGVENSVNDYKGEYGMTQDSFGICYNREIDGINIINSIKTNKFITLLKESCNWSNFRIDYRMFNYFKKDFWKEFL